GPVAPTSHDMAREHRVLSVLYRAFPPAPRAYLFCDDPSLIGAPFFVMERRRGVVVRGVVPAEFGGGSDAAANRKLSEVLIDTLVDFHAVDPARGGLEGLSKPDRLLARLPWYYVFGMFKIAVIVQQIHFRYHRGQTQDARFAPMGEIAERLMVLARNHAAALG